MVWNYIKQQAFVSHISVRINSHSLQTTGNHSTIRASNILQLKMSSKEKVKQKKTDLLTFTALASYRLGR